MVGREGSGPREKKKTLAKEEREKPLELEARTVGSAQIAAGTTSGDRRRWMTILPGEPDERLTGEEV